MNDGTLPKQIAMSFGEEDEDDGARVRENGREPLNTASHSNSASLVPSTPNGTPPAGYQAPPTSTTPFVSDDFAISLLAISRVRGIGPKTLRLLIDHFGDPSGVWTADEADLIDVLQRAKVKDSISAATTLLGDQAALHDAAEHDVKRLQAANVQLIGKQHAVFPRRLANRPDGPYWLFVEGNLDALQAPLIGIVGTRKPSAIGIQAAERLTAIVCREGFGIVSGLAEGIDASAHRVGLYYRSTQVAVLGTGIDIVFPASTESTRWKILETGGAVISEYFPGDSYSRANFVQRNRIQAALSLALCPVESQEKSGTTHTLNFAEQYHRPIFGVQRGQPALHNDMVRLLTKRDAPIFDLNDTPGMTELLDWLKTIIPADAWPQEKPSVDRWFFQELLRQIDDIMDDIPINTNDLQWLQEQIARRSNPTSSRSSEKDAA